MVKKVHDIETLRNCFVYCDVDVADGKENTFVICPWVNNLESFIRYLSKVNLLIGYNNLAFDSQVIEYILENYDIWIEAGLSGEAIAKLIYGKSQMVIASDKMIYPEYTLRIRHHDLFKMWHFDNMARSTRLKDLQVAMDWYNVQDMPIHHSVEIDTAEQLAEIISYCRNDIRSTYEFYKRSKEQIQLRESLSKTFSIDLINASDAKLGQEIFAKLIADNTGEFAWRIKLKRTYRDKIELGKILLPYIKFDDARLTGLLDKVRKTTVVETKGAFKESVTIRGFRFDMGLGGIHGCIKSGVYEDSETVRILDIDVKSFYPWLAIANQWYPEHLGKIFSDICKELFDERVRIPKDDPINYAYKIMLNAVYGKSNDEDSFFYDPRYTMQITVNGQLLLLMLAEKLLGVGCIVLQANTDGITVMHDRSKEKQIGGILSWWQSTTGLTLEYAEYRKMIIRDVNNYLAIDVKGKIKYKGIFELFNNTDPSFKDWHKDPSFRIVARAVSEYFINGTDVEETIKENINILQFCGRAKFKSNSTGVTKGIIDGVLVREKQQKTSRYYVSKGGKQLIKEFDDGRQTVIHRGKMVTIYNTHVDGITFRDKIDYSFYIKEAKKIIESIEGDKNQLNLWG